MRDSLKTAPDDDASTSLLAISSEWARLKHGQDDRFYSKRHVYDMRWRLDAEVHLFMSAAAPCGGPIALLRGDGTGAGARLQIFNAAGELLCAWVWEHPRVLKLGWTSGHELLTVLETGRVLLWSLQGERLSDLGLGKECEQQGVLRCEVWPDGLVVLTHAFRLFALLSFAHPRVLPLADPNLTSAPTAMCLLHHAPDGGGAGGGAGGAGGGKAAARVPEVVLATASRTLLVVDEHEAQDQLLTSGPFVELAPSPNGSFLAAFSAAGSLLVLTSDFSRTLSEFVTKTTRPPRALVWCGTDSLVLHWERVLLMVGPYGDWVKYTYDGALLLLPEMDGVRLTSATTTELLQRVPETTEGLFKPGSLAPAARLLEASEAFARRSARADELLRGLGAELPGAVVACLQAAEHELEAPLQRRLLRAAAYGKCYAPDEAEVARRFVATCKRVRVLNAVRRPEVGLLLTAQQYELLGPQRLLLRLLAQQQHLLALRLSEFLRLPRMQAAVVHHWGRCKIHSVAASHSDESLHAALLRKLRACPAASHAELAAEAHRVGRRSLALMLVAHETHATRQVPLLLHMGEPQQALDRAVASGDTELVYLVLLHAKDNLPAEAFFDMLLPAQAAQAQQLLVGYASSRDAKLLKDFYFHLDQPLPAAQLAIREGYRAPEWKQRTAGLGIALDFYEHNASARDGGGQTCATLARATDEQLRLLHAQRQLELDTQGAPPPPGAPPDELRAQQRWRFVDAPLNATLYRCFCYGQPHAAERLRVDFKVPDRRWWRLKVRGLAHAHAWPALWDFSHAKAKSPVGLEPFLEASAAQGARDEAARYAARMPPAEAVPALLRVGIPEAARRIAVQHKEKHPDLLTAVSAHIQERERGGGGGGGGGGGQ